MLIIYTVRNAFTDKQSTVQLLHGLTYKRINSLVNHVSTARLEMPFLSFFFFSFVLLLTLLFVYLGALGLYSTIDLCSFDIQKNTFSGVHNKISWKSNNKMT